MVSLGAPARTEILSVKITSCRFECSAYRPEDEPRATGPSVLFLGRSNVGKSSLINRLLGVRGLARMSSTPGRTQSVNFYRINERIHFVDLPGYGHANAPRQVRESWKTMVEGFLERCRDRVALAILLVDARHGATELDRVMQEWLEAEEIPYLVTATKSDKLSGNGRASARRSLERELTGDSLAAPPILTSARTGLGVREIWRHLDGVLGGA
jgi:GTP-binding protein